MVMMVQEISRARCTCAHSHCKCKEKKTTSLLFDIGSSVVTRLWIYDHGSRCSSATGEAYVARLFWRMSIAVGDLPLAHPKLGSEGREVELNGC